MAYEFMGYVRPDGQVGCRNHVAIMPSVTCAGDVASAIVRQVAGTVGYFHHQGCCQLPPDLDRVTETLISLGKSPNVAAVLVVSLGCEGTDHERLTAEIRKTGKPVRIIRIQELGGVSAAIKAGIDAAQELVMLVSGIQRQPVSIDHITMAIKCGASDTTSGMASNCVVGYVADKLVDLGATVVFGETTEFLGGEHLLARRAVNPEVSDKIYEIVNRMEARARSLGCDMRKGQPTPGNIEGGLSSIEEKSLGAIVKSGTRPIQGVMEYPETIGQRKGLWIKDTPGREPEILTGMAATGAQFMMFSTGRGAPVTIQSMCNTHTEDAKATIAQIHALEEAGCEIVRVTVPNMEAAHALSEIKENISIPLVADIHFDYRLAVEAAARGADKIRINPGNIGGDDRVKAVVDACREHKVPIRIGVNGGSLEKELLAKYGRVTPEALVESALRHVRLLEKFDFTEICISVKSSDVPLNMAAYRLLHEKVDYPLHLGVTEAGTPTMGLLKSAIGIGGLLCEGIGDTMRVSLTADPVEEVYAAKRILQACGIRRSGVNLVSCPTCGRTAYDMIPIAEELERRLADCKKNITVAVMGCVVNGPGEASAADIGVAGGKGEGMIFRKGKILYKVPQEKLVDALMEEIKKL